MLILTITIEEKGDQVGPARKVHCHVKCEGFASEAEHEFAEHFKPLIEQIMGTKAITGRDTKPSTS